jgi:hypothetical protein
MRVECDAGDCGPAGGHTRAYLAVDVHIPQPRRAALSGRHRRAAGTECHPVYLIGIVEGRADLLVGDDIPEMDGAAKFRGGQESTVWAERHCDHGRRLDDSAATDYGRADLPLGCDVPEPGAVAVSGGKNVAVGAERHGGYSYSAARVDGHRSADLAVGGDIPELGGAVTIAGGQDVSVRAEHNSRYIPVTASTLGIECYWRAVDDECADLAVGGDIPKPGTVAVGSGQDFAVGTERYGSDVAVGD